MTWCRSRVRSMIGFATRSTEASSRCCSRSWSSNSPRASSRTLNDGLVSRARQGAMTCSVSSSWLASSQALLSFSVNTCSPIKAASKAVLWRTASASCARSTWTSTARSATTDLLATSARKATLVSTGSASHVRADSEESARLARQEGAPSAVRASS